MKKIILIFSILTIMLCNNAFAQDNSNEIDPNASKIKGTGVNTEAIFDILRNYNVDSLITIAQGYGVVWTGNYYIVSHFSSNQFFKISVNWTLIQGPIVISGSTLPAAQGFRDMEFARGFLWGVAPAATGGNRIYKVDTTAFSQVGVINLPAGVLPRDLAWDAGRNGFWVSTNSFSGNLQCYDTNGVAISGALIPTVTGGFYGIAYDGSTAGGPYLWLAKDPVPSGPSITSLVRFNIAAAPIRLDSAVITIPGTVGAPNLASGGLDFKTNLIPGKSTLIGLVQGTPDRVVVYEVGNIGPPAGGTITVSRSGIYKSIPENGGNANPMLDTISVTGIPSGNEIKKISVKIDTVIHTWIGDLRFWLTHNTQVDTIISRVGWTGTGFGNSCNDFIGTNLVDSVGPINIQNIPSACIGVQAQTTGTFNPKSPLAVFNQTGDPNGLYILRICDNAAGDTGALRNWSITIDYGIISGISNNTNLANEYKLSQNYPNPFNPTTKIDFSIPKSGQVTVKVFDIIGKEVATLVNEYMNAGNHEITFNGSSLSSGMYFYRIESGNFVQTKKMTLLK